MPRVLKKKPFSFKWFILGLAITLIAAGAFLFEGGHPPAYCLTIYEGRSDRVLYRREIETGSILKLNYIHSADGTPVSAVFEIHKDGLHLIEESYSWYGAGLESGSEYTFSFREEKVTVSGYERIFLELPIRVARTVPQEMFLGGDVIYLNRLAPGGTLLLVKIEDY